MEHSLTSSPAHTPGPWQINEYRDCVSDGTRVLAEKPHGPAHDWEANARLIAAAPELLAMCKILYSIWVGEEPSPQRVIEITAQLEDAIAKAEGSTA